MFKQPFNLYLFSIFITSFLIGCAVPKKEKTKEEIYKSWEGLYTYSSYNKEKDTIYRARYTFIIDSLTPALIKDNQKEYVGEIIKIRENEITFNFTINKKQEEYKIVKKDSTFFPKGKIITEDSLEIVNNKWQKLKDYSKLKLPLNQLSKIYKVEYREGNASVNSKNGLVLRNKPSLESEKLITIPYKTPLMVVANTDNFEYLTLSKKNKVVGRWIHVYFKDEQGNYNVGYVFDYFITYDYDIYNLPIDRSSEDPERQYINIYTAKQFFENLGDMRTLNIKVKTLDLFSYLKNRESLEYDYDEIDFDIDFLDSKHNYGYFEKSVAKIELFLQGYYDLEITSEAKSIIKTPPLHFLGCHGVLFDNVIFKTKYLQTNYQKELGESFAFNVGNRTESLFFSNIEFNNQQFKISYLSMMPLQFEYCKFKNYTKNCIVSTNNSSRSDYDSPINMNDCYFWNNKLETFFELREEKLSINNSFIGYNSFKNMCLNSKENDDNLLFKTESTYFTNNSDK